MGWGEDIPTSEVPIIDASTEDAAEQICATLAREAGEINNARAEIDEFFHPTPNEPEENNSEQEEAAKLNKIKDYEKVNSVNQDIIAESYLVHVDHYRKLSQKNTNSMNKFFALEKGSGTEHPETISAKEDWLEAADALTKHNNTMQEMLGNLPEETLKKYRQDFINHGAINSDFLTKEEKGK